MTSANKIKKKIYIRKLKIRNRKIVIQTLTFPDGFYVEIDSSTTSMLYFYKKRKKIKNNGVLKHAKTV